MGIFGCPFRCLFASKLCDPVFCSVDPCYAMHTYPKAIKMIAHSALNECAMRCLFDIIALPSLVMLYIAIRSDV